MAVGFFHDPFAGLVASSTSQSLSVRLSSMVDQLFDDKREPRVILRNQIQDHVNSDYGKWFS
jgi:hypothetical protein